MPDNISNSREIPRETIHTLLFTEYGGIDWHDSCTTNKQIKQDGSYDIKDPDAAKAEFLLADINGMYESTAREGDSQCIKLENIPDYDRLLQAVKNKEDILLTSLKKEYECNGEKCEYSDLEWRYEGASGRITKEFAAGQISYHGHFMEMDIPKENVAYLAVENFLAPRKGVPSVQRFYHEPYSDAKEAEEALDRMQLHEGYRSVKELYVIDTEKEKETNWYKCNAAEIGKPFKLYPSLENLPEADRPAEGERSEGEHNEEEPYL